MQPEDKLNIDSLTLDNVIGDGVETIENVQDVIEDIPQEVEDVQEDNVDPQTGDEDADDTDGYQPVEEETYAEDEYEETDSGDEERTSVAAEVARTLGFELEGDYDDSLEGITNFVRDISQNAAEDQLQSLFEQFPDVQQHLDYVLAGGESREFFQKQGQQVDFNAIEITEENVSMQRAVLAQYLQNKGHDTEFIQDTIDTYETSGKLYSNAEKAKQYLAQFQAEEQQMLLQEQQEAQAAFQEQQNHFWNEVAVPT